MYSKYYFLQDADIFQEWNKWKNMENNFSQIIYMDVLEKKFQKDLNKNWPHSC